MIMVTPSLFLYAGIPQMMFRVYTTVATGKSYCEREVRYENVETTKINDLILSFMQSQP